MMMMMIGCELFLISGFMSVNVSLEFVVRKDL